MVMTSDRRSHAMNAARSELQFDDVRRLSPPCAQLLKSLLRSSPRPGGIVLYSISTRRGLSLTCVKRNPSADFRPGPAAVRRRIAPSASPPPRSDTCLRLGSATFRIAPRCARHVPAGSSAAPASSLLQHCVSRWALDASRHSHHLGRPAATRDSDPGQHAERPCRGHTTLCLTRERACVSRGRKSR